MPKREIRAQDYRFVPLPDGVDGAVGYPPECRLGSLHIGWTNPGNIVEVITHDDTMRYTMFGQFLSDLRTIRDRTGSGTDRVALDDAVEEFERLLLPPSWPTFGVAVTLDRPGVQNAIKALREGRNAIWGRDE